MQQIRREDIRKLLHSTGFVNVQELVSRFGVSSETIRRDLEAACQQAGCTLYLPPLKLCGDNGSMIGSQGYYEYLAGTRGGEDLNGYANRDISLPYRREGV